MINKENILKTAQTLVRQYDLPLKIRGVEEGREEVIIHFTSGKRPQLRELTQELEIRLNLPIKLQQIKKEELGKIGGVDILGKYTCCAPFLRKCPFGEKFGCGYGFSKVSESRGVRVSKTEGKPADAKAQKGQKRKKTEKKKKKKVVRRLVLKK